MTEGALQGCRVLVTRPAAQAQSLIDAIKANGGEAIAFPVIELKPREAADIRNDHLLLPEPDLVIFVSANAARYGAFAAQKPGTQVAAIGPATRAVLAEQGLRNILLPDEHFDSEHLLEHPALHEVADCNVTIVRGTDGRDYLANELEKRGATVNYLAVYTRECRRVPEREIVALDSKWRTAGIDVTSIMSIATLKHLMELLPDRLHGALRQTPLVAPGDRVIQTAIRMLPGVATIRADGPRPDDIISALIDWKQSGQNTMGDTHR